MHEKVYTREHDAQLKPQQLIDAALAYTVQAQDRLSAADGEGVGADVPETYWPWAVELFTRPTTSYAAWRKAKAPLAAAYDAAKARHSARDE
jgi:hypothetical protein